MNEAMIKEMSKMQLLNSRYNFKINNCPFEIKKEEEKAHFVFDYICNLKQQLKDKDEKISKVIEYCLIEREDINGSKCDDILEILESNKED